MNSETFKMLKEESLVLLDSYSSAFQKPIPDVYIEDDVVNGVNVFYVILQEKEGEPKRVATIYEGEGYSVEGLAEYISLCLLVVDPLIKLYLDTVKKLDEAKSGAQSKLDMLKYLVSNAHRTNQWKTLQVAFPDLLEGERESKNEE